MKPKRYKNGKQRYDTAIAEGWKLIMGMHDRCYIPEVWEREGHDGKLEVRAAFECGVWVDPQEKKIARYW